MASTYLTRTQVSGNRKTWTFSGWIKLGEITTADQVIWSSNNPPYYSTLLFADHVLRYVDYFGGITHELKTSQFFRDPSAWYHIVIAYDTTQATTSNRTKIYINGEQVTSFSVSTYPSLNYDSYVNASGYTFHVGTQTFDSPYYNGYMADVYFIDGLAYDASTFGSFDSTTGIWKPNTAPTVTYGTNGFNLKFTNGADAGEDFSGNNNDFATNGTPTQTLDCPSNVFATMNPLYNFSADNTYSNGNLKIVAGGAWSGALSTLAVSQGKYYWEIKLTGTMTNHFIGVQTINVDVSTINPQQKAGTLVLYNNDGGVIEKDNSNIGGTYGTFSSGDIAGMALDMGAGSYGQLTIYKNGVAIASNIDLSSTSNGAILPFSATNGSTEEYNFGNGFFGTTAVVSAGTNAGVGTFEYDVPAGYYALCTKNINTQEYS